LPKITPDLQAQIAVPNGPTDVLIFDDELAGFFLRIARKTGRSTYGADYRVAGKRRRIKLGPADGTADALRNARKAARQVLAEATLGQDALGRRAQQQKAGAETFGRLVQAFLRDQERVIRPKTHEEWSRYLLRYVRTLHGTPISQLNKLEASNELARVAREHTATASDRCLTAMVATFSWAVRTGRLEANPLLGMSRRSARVERDRSLDDGELAEVWRHAGEAGSDFADIVKLLILTACRREEIGTLAWNEIDAERRLIVLHPPRVKGDTPLRLPLSNQALAVLDARPRWAQRDRVFGLSTDGNGFSGWSRCKARLDDRIARARISDGRRPIEPWRLHDLRRSVATGMARLGVSEGVADRCLNHVPATSAVSRIYQRHSFEREMRAAFELWGNHIESIVSDGIQLLSDNT
jgi:integrase